MDIQKVRDIWAKIETVQRRLVELNTELRHHIEADDMPKAGVAPKVEAKQAEAPAQKKQPTYTDEKVSEVRSFVIQNPGKSAISNASRKFGIPPATIRRWCHALQEG